MNVKIEYIKQCKGRRCKVGLQHFRDANKLFYYYGTLKDVASDGTIILETRDGVAFFDIDQIKQFHVEGPWGLF